MNKLTETKLGYQYLFVYLLFKTVKIMHKYALLNFAKPRLTPTLYLFEATKTIN